MLLFPPNPNENELSGTADLVVEAAGEANSKEMDSIIFETVASSLLVSLTAVATGVLWRVYPVCG